jgi:hypothetical protein
MGAPKKVRESDATSASLTSLFDLWEKDHVANGKPKKTVNDFRQKNKNLQSFLGHDDAKSVTGENIAD